MKLLISYNCRIMTKSNTSVSSCIQVVMAEGGGVQVTCTLLYCGIACSNSLSVLLEDRSTSTSTLYQPFTAKILVFSTSTSSWYLYLQSVLVVLLAEQVNLQTAAGLRIIPDAK